MAYKESDTKRKIEYYADTANLLLEEEAYDIASDFYTLAGFYSLNLGDSASAKEFTAKALESCRKGNIQDHHYLFALSLQELSSSNIDKAVEYWNRTKSKYTEDEIELVEQILGAHREVLPQEGAEEALDTFLEATQDEEERVSMEIFEEIALETTQQKTQPVEEASQETISPYWAEEETPAVREKEYPQPETPVQEPEEEWELVPEPSEPTHIEQPEIEPVIKEEAEEIIRRPEPLEPAKETFIPSQIPPKPQIMPAAPRISPQEFELSKPQPTITSQPPPIEGGPPAPVKEAPITSAIKVSGKNLYDRIKISDIAWRVGRTEKEMVDALSNLINQGRIPGYIQAGEYIQNPNVERTQLSTQIAPTPTAEAPSKFFTTSEADVTAATKEGYKRCGVCGVEIPDWTRICPKCGAKQ